MPYINTESDFRLLTESNDYLVTEDFDPSEIGITGGGLPPKTANRTFKKDRRLRELLEGFAEEVGAPEAKPEVIAKKVEAAVAAGRPLVQFDIDRVKTIIKEAEAVEARIVEMHMKAVLRKAEEDEVMYILKALV